MGAAPIIAAARVNGTLSLPVFESMVGFVNPPTKISAGIYQLTLLTPPPNNVQTIPLVTALGPAPGDTHVQALTLLSGEIQVIVRDQTGTPIDSLFYIGVLQAPVFP